MVISKTCDVALVQIECLLIKRCAARIVGSLAEFHKRD